MACARRRMREAEFPDIPGRQVPSLTSWQRIHSSMVNEVALARPSGIPDPRERRNVGARQCATEMLLPRKLPSTGPRAGRTCGGECLSASWQGAGG